jgi:hypothetical protein
MTFFPRFGKTKIRLKILQLNLAQKEKHLESFKKFLFSLMSCYNMAASYVALVGNPWAKHGLQVLGSTIVNQII